MFHTPFYMLESFYYILPWQIKWHKEHPGRFMLDSGVFTLLNSGMHQIDKLDTYIDRYIEFINQNDIDKFVEMDLDRYFTLNEVEGFRKKIERGTGKKTIPVWHPNRGKDYFIRMCEDYDYVAFGAFITDNIPFNKLEPVLPWFINTAHKHNTKIHALGLGSGNALARYNFDSADSTRWLAMKFGHLYRFNGHGMVMVKNTNSVNRLKTEESILFNFREYLKLANYLEGKR